MDVVWWNKDGKLKKVSHCLRIEERLDWSVSSNEIEVSLNAIVRFICTRTQEGGWIVSTDFCDCFRTLVRTVWNGCLEWYGNNDTCKISKGDTIFLREKLPLAQLRSKKPQPTSVGFHQHFHWTGLTRYDCNTRN